MRSFTDAQLQVQMSGGYTPYVMLYFADPKGVGAYTGTTRWPYKTSDTTGVAKRCVHTEEEYGASGYVLLDNSDGTWDNIDLTGSLVTMLWVIRSSDGQLALSAYMVPLWVVGQPEYSGVNVGAEVALNLSSEMELWSRDVTSKVLSSTDSENYASKATDYYALQWKAVMDQLCKPPDLVNDQIEAFNHWSSNASLYWESDYRPSNVDAQHYWYPAGTSRIQILRDMMAIAPSNRGIRWEATSYTDGGSLHYVAVSSTPDQTYEAYGSDYIQWLSRVRNSGLVMPNEVVVTSGNQNDVSVKSQPSYDRRPVTEYIHLGQVDSGSVDSMMTNPANVRIAQAEAMAGGGEFYGRMNLASEINDYITVMDSQRTENDLTGYIKRITRDTANWSNDAGGMTTTIGDVNPQDRSTFYQARVAQYGGKSDEVIERLIVKFADNAKLMIERNRRAEAKVDPHTPIYANLEVGETVFENALLIKKGSLYYAASHLTENNCARGQLVIAMKAGNQYDRIMCLVSGDLPSVTFASANAQVFVGATPGTMSSTAPSTAGYIVRVAGETTADKSLFFQPSIDWGEKI